MVPFRCTNPHCRRELGRTDGRVLVFGVEVGGVFVVLARISQRTALHCPQCCKISVWKRLESQPIRAIEAYIDNEKQACYT